MAGRTNSAGKTSVRRFDFLQISQLTVSISLPTMTSSVYRRVCLFLRHTLSLLNQVRFTLVMVSLLTCVAIWSETHIGPLRPDLRQTFGFAPQHLPALHWYRLFTSVLFTAGGTTFYQALAMLAFCVACCEWLIGTRKTVFVFWATHLATLAAILTPIALAAASLGAAWAELLVRAADVGPSAGYYGCLGVAVWHSSTGRRRLLVTAVLAIFAVRLAWSMVVVPDQGRQIAADMAHLIAFPLGILFGSRMARRRVIDAKPS